MARPLDIKKRNEITERAVKVLVDRGVHGTTMSDLARALDIKRPTLYWYFPDLGALFDAIFDFHNQRFNEAVLPELAGIEDPVAALDLFLERVLQNCDAYRDEIVLMFQLWAVGRSDAPEDVLARGREFLNPFRELLLQLIRSAQEQKQIRAMDPEGLADLVLSLVHGALFQKVVRHADLSAMRDVVRQLVWSQLGGDKNDESSQ
jgi:AcrR family transcriptional regulator